MLDAASKSVAGSMGEEVGLSTSRGNKHQREGEPASLKYAISVSLAFKHQVSTH